MRMVLSVDWMDFVLRQTAAGAGAELALIVAGFAAGCVPAADAAAEAGAPGFACAGVAPSERTRMVVLPEIQFRGSWLSRQDMAL